MIPNANDQAVDLMLKMMVFDPQKRITPAQALKHPYFDGFKLEINTNNRPASKHQQIVGALNNAITPKAADMVQDKMKPGSK